MSEMGCSISKFDSDVILQCKERRNLIKKAVECRDDFATAHEAYIQALRNVGRALRRFSEAGEEGGEEEGEGEEGEGEEEGEGGGGGGKGEERIGGEGNGEEGREENREEEQKGIAGEGGGGGGKASNILVRKSSDSKSKSSELISAVEPAIESRPPIPILTEESRSPIPILTKESPPLTSGSISTLEVTPSTPLSPEVHEYLSPPLHSQSIHNNLDSNLDSSVNTKNHHHHHHHHNSDDDENGDDHNDYLDPDLEYHDHIGFEYTDEQHGYESDSPASVMPFPRRHNPLSSPSSSSSSSWFLYDIFEAPPIPYHLLRNRRRRRRQGRGHSHSGHPGRRNGNEYEVEEEEEGEEVSGLDEVRRGEGIPDLEEMEINEEEEKAQAQAQAQAHSQIARGVGSGKEPSKVGDGKEPSKVGDGKEPSSVEVEARTHKPAPPPLTHDHASSATPNHNNGTHHSIGNAATHVPPTLPNVVPEEPVVVIVANNGKPKTFAVSEKNGHRDLAQALRYIHAYFSRAHRSGQEVSHMLATRLAIQLLNDIDFREPSKVFNAITMRWSRRTNTLLKDAYEPGSVVESDHGSMFGTHASTLEQLHAWEKKLYEEVKAGEVIRMAFDRKRHQLYNLNASGGDLETIHKIRTALVDLENRLEVALKAIQLASSRVRQLTNEELYPQLTELARGLMNMWRVMWKCHKAQSVMALEMQPLAQYVVGDFVSVAHISMTNRLEHELENWKACFRLWIKSQRNYIDTLYKWLWESQIETTPVTLNNELDDRSQVVHLLSNWRNALRELESREQPIDAIHNFMAALDILGRDQKDEMGTRRHGDRLLRRLEKNYVRSSSERSDIEQHRHLEALHEWREQIALSFKEHLPLIFDAAAGFAKVASKAYERVHQNNVESDI